MAVFDWRGLAGSHVHSHGRGAGVSTRAAIVMSMDHLGEDSSASVGSKPPNGRAGMGKYSPRRISPLFH